MIRYLRNFCPFTGLSFFKNLGPQNISKVIVCFWAPMEDIVDCLPYISTI